MVDSIWRAARGNVPDKGMRLLRQLLMRKRSEVQKVARWCWSNDGVSWSPVCDDVARCHILREIGERLIRIPPTVASVTH
jgi:hypothetical protein